MLLDREIGDCSGRVRWIVVAGCLGESGVVDECLEDVNSGGITMLKLVEHFFKWGVLLPIVYGFVVWRIYVGVFRHFAEANQHPGAVECGAEFQQTVRFVVKFRKGRRFPKVLCKIVGDVETTGARSDVNDG